MITECIILAGGLGTRLQSVVADVPKCMAPVAGKPFIHWVLANLLQQKINKFIFSVGYLHHIIENYLTQTYPHLNIKYSLESEPLGTGGAVKLALAQCTQNNVLIVNGDTLFEINNQALFNMHHTHNATCTIALKQMYRFDRYGTVTLNDANQIISFQEKKMMDDGLINGGVYLLNREAFKKINFPSKFSLEKDFLEKKVGNVKIMATINEGYFVDIGVPSDYKKADKEIKQKYNVAAK